MDDNQHNIWMAMSELDEYFSQLGGAARPRNMAESEIPLYVACKIFELHDNTFKSKDYLDCDFLDDAALVLEKSDVYLKNVTLNASELVTFILDLYENVNLKLRDSDKTSRWEALGNYLRKKNTEIDFKI